MSGKIIQAVVYLSGAQITRVQSFKLKSGVNKVAFKDLPAYLDNKSITASTDGRSVVLSVSHKTVHAKTESKRISELYDELVLLRDKLDLSRMRYSVLNEEEELIRKNTQTPDGKTFRADDMKDAVFFFRDRMTSLSEEKFELSKEIKKLSERILYLEAEIGTDRWDGERSQVEIEVHSEGSLDSEITITYFVDGAGWTPYYDIRVKDLDTPLSLELKALVHQNTGEDWNATELVLSTGDPTLSGNAPELKPWYIDFYEPIRALSELEFRSVSLAKRAAPMAAGEEPIAPLSDLSVIHTETVTGIEYTLPVPYTVHSSNNKRSVDIATYELDADFVYKSIRKLDKDVFLVADVKDWEHLNLLGGNANIFFEDKFVGEVTIDPRRTEERLKISLGRDKNIVVTRTRGKDMIARSSMGSNVKESRGWEITAKNLRKQKIDLIIKDQIPVSVNKNIVVDAVNISDAEYDKETGKLKWKISLEPAESKSFTIKYTVTHPKNKTVILE